MQPPFYKFILDTLVEGAVIEDAGSAPELQTLLTEAGMTLLDYVNCDLDLATNQKIGKVIYWLASGKKKTASSGEEERRVHQL